MNSKLKSYTSICLAGLVTGSYAAVAKLLS